MDIILYFLISLGTLNENLIHDYKKMDIKLRDIISVMPRTFNQILNSFEVFLKNGKSYFFVLYSKKILSKFFSIFNEFLPKLKLTINRREFFEKSGFQSKWQDDKISNYE